MIIKKVLASFCSLVFLWMVFCVSADAAATSWYCRRNTEHKQIEIAPELAYVERYGGYFIDKAHGDECQDKVIYLTFDAGYENGNIEKILDVMKQENVKGAFFILSNLITKNPDLVLRMSQEGHTVCNHTSKHRDMTRVESIEEFSAELSALEKLYYECTGKEMSKYYRPPEGRVDERSMQYANALGYKTVFWSFAYADWDNSKQPSAESAKKKIMDNIHNGEVMLLHPTSDTNAEILGDVIRSLREQGYRFGEISELCGDV